MLIHNCAVVSGASRTARLASSSLLLLPFSTPLLATCQSLSVPWVATQSRTRDLVPLLIFTSFITHSSLCPMFFPRAENFPTGICFFHERCFICKISHLVLSVRVYTEWMVYVAKTMRTILGHIHSPFLWKLLLKFS